jgi:hypothetical protein
MYSARLSDFVTQLSIAGFKGLRLVKPKLEDLPTILSSLAIRFKRMIENALHSTELIAQRMERGPLQRSLSLASLQSGMERYILLRQIMWCEEYPEMDW